MLVILETVGEDAEFKASLVSCCKYTKELSPRSHGKAGMGGHPSRKFS